MLFRSDCLRAASLAQSWRIHGMKIAWPANTMDSRAYPFGYAKPPNAATQGGCVLLRQCKSLETTEKDGHLRPAAGLASRLQYLNESKLEKEVTMAGNGLRNAPETVIVAMK